MAGFLKGPGHFQTHALSGMPMPGLGPFGLTHSLEPVPYPQGNYMLLHSKEIID